MADENTNRIRVIVCRVDERAEVIEIEDKLEAMQEVVGGLIQEYIQIYHNKKSPAIAGDLSLCRSLIILSFNLKNEFL